jgi:hypothetical protein
LVFSDVSIVKLIEIVVGHPGVDNKYFLRYTIITCPLVVYGGYLCRFSQLKWWCFVPTPAIPPTYAIDVCVGYASWHTTLILLLLSNNLVSSLHMPLLFPHRSPPPNQACSELAPNTLYVVMSSLFELLLVVVHYVPSGCNLCSSRSCVPRRRGALPLRDVRRPGRFNEVRTCSLCRSFPHGIPPRM